MSAKTRAQMEVYREIFTALPEDAMTPDNAPVGSQVLITVYSMWYAQYGPIFEVKVIAWKNGFVKVRGDTRGWHAEGTFRLLEVLKKGKG